MTSTGTHKGVRDLLGWWKKRFFIASRREARELWAAPALCFGGTGGFDSKGQC